MDLLAAYGSDSDQASDDDHPTANGRVTLLTHSPVQQRQLDESSGPAPHLEPQSSAANVEKALSKLPAPRATTGKRRPVQIRVPLMLNPPPDSDSEDEAPQKKLKTSGGAKLKDFLPAPKNTVLGGGASNRKTGGGTAFDKGMPLGPPAAAAPAVGAVPSKDADAAYHLDNEAFQVHNDGASAYAAYGGHTEAASLPSNFFEAGQPMYAAETAAGYASLDTGTYGTTNHGLPGSTAFHQSGPAAGPAVGANDGDRMLEAALLAEVEKLNKKQRAKDPLKNLDVSFVEVTQEKLAYMSPAQRESLNATRTVLGPGYEAKLRQEAGPQPEKLARRKHQISSLYHQAKMKELDAMDMRSRSLKTKAETQAKYGW